MLQESDDVEQASRILASAFGHGDSWFTGDFQFNRDATASSEEGGSRWPSTLIWLRSMTRSSGFCGAVPSYPRTAAQGARDHCRELPEADARR